MLGFGLSDKPYPHNYSIIEQADIYSSLLQKFKVKSVNILAHDYGVSVGQELLARHQYGKNPFQIQSIVFLNGGLFPALHRALLSQKILSNPTIGPTLGRIVGAQSFLFARSFSSVFGDEIPPSEEFVNDVYLLNTHKHGLYVVSDILGYIQDRRDNEDRWTGALKWAHEVNKEDKVNLPLFLINGPIDPVSGKHVFEHYMQLFPNGKGKLLDPGVGHYPQIQDPVGVLKAFLQFHSLV